MALTVPALTFLSLYGVVVGQTYDAAVNSISVIPLVRSRFFSQEAALTSDPVRFVSSIRGLPDPPAWLTYLQRDKLQDAYLYGSPQDHRHDSAVVEIVAVNERTQQTSYNTVNISVERDEGKPLNLLRFYVTDQNLDEFLGGDHVMHMERIVRRMWSAAGDLRTTRLTTIAKETGETPVPSKPGQQIKEGVVIELGSIAPFPPVLLKARRQADQACLAPHQVEQAVSIAPQFSTYYDIDWCAYDMITTSMAKDLTSTPAPVPVAMDTGLPWSRRVVPRREMFWEFLLVVALPVVVAAILLVVLSYVMFGRRKKEATYKTTEMAPQTQLVEYDTIRRATTNLRYMSTRRDGPPPLGSTAPSALNTPSPTAHNTLNRHKEEPKVEPPPYRLPPTYPTPGGSTDRRRSGADDEQHLVPDAGEAETLRVRD